MKINHYRFRYYYAFSIVLTVLYLGFHFFLCDALLQLQLLQQIKKNRLQWLTLKKSYLPQAQLAVKTAVSLQGLSLPHLQKQLSYLGLTLDQLSDLDSGLLGVNAKPIHLIISGGFKNMITFIHNFNKPESGVVMTNFTFTAKATLPLRLSVDLILFNNRGAALMTNSASDLTTKNFFCQSNTPLSPKPLNPVRYTLKEVKLVATVQRMNLSEAWLRLPNTAVIAVKKGIFFGKEHAQLLEISRNYITWLLGNHSYYRMWIRDKP